MGIETLNEDLELNIPMFDDDMDIISKLDDEPNAVGGLTAAELKAEFDRPGKTIQEYLNKTLIPSLIGTVAEESVRAQNEYIRVTNENQRVANENGRVEEEERRNTAELERIENEDSRGDNETKRVQAETARAAAEAQRESAEQAREDKTSGIVAQATEQANEAKNQADRAEEQAKKAGDEADRAAEQANLARQVKSMQAEATTLTAGSEATAKVEEENGNLVLKVGIPQGPAGATGPAGPTGADGIPGKTAYEYAKDGGFTGTEEEFAKLLANGNGGGADWDQNDPEGAGYVKSRTHYREPKYKDTFPETSVAFDSSAALIDRGSGKALVDGETYFVTWNGETYQVEASVFAESGEVYVGDWDTKEHPFFIENSGATRLYVSKATSTIETITLKIQQLDGWDYHPFLAEYLPPEAPLAKHVDEEVLPECSYDSDGFGYVYGDYVLELHEGWVYDVVWNGALYRCPAIMQDGTLKLTQAYVDGTDLLMDAPFQQFYPPKDGPVKMPDGRWVCAALIGPYPYSGTVSITGYTMVNKLDPMSLPTRPDVFEVEFGFTDYADTLQALPNNDTAHLRCMAAEEAGKLIVAKYQGYRYNLVNHSSSSDWVFSRVAADKGSPVLGILYWDSNYQGVDDPAVTITSYPLGGGGGGVSKASELDNDVPFVSASDSQTLTEDQQKKAQENIGLGGLVVSEGGDTLTWDGNTEGLVSVLDVYYKVPDVVITAEDIGSLLEAGNNLDDTKVKLSTGEFMSGGFLAAPGFIAVGEVCFIISEEAVGIDFDGLYFQEAGIYFAYLAEEGAEPVFASSLTIPGYTGFVKKQVNPEYIPDMYYEEVVENVIVENATLNVTQSGPLGFSSMNEFALDEIKDGVTYTVVWDGTSYECVAHPCTGMAPPIAGTYNAIGNGSIINSSDVDSGEPFVILVAGGGGVFVLSKTSGTYTLSLTCPETVVHKIPTKYLPANNFTITMSMGAGPGSWSIDKTVEDITKAISKGDVVYIDATVAGAGVVSLTSISTDGAFIFSTFEIGTSIIFFYDVHISTTGQVTFRTYSLNKTQ